MDGNRSVILFPSIFFCQKALYNRFYAYPKDYKLNTVNKQSGSGVGICNYDIFLFNLLVSKNLNQYDSL